MGATINYPDGSSLTSTALTLNEINAVLQPWTLTAIGQAAEGVDPQSGLVRIKYPTTGAPFARVTEDVCYISCMPKDDAYDRIRDRVNTPNNGTSLIEVWNYTRAWSIHFTHYGPNSLDLARAVRSALYQDYFNAALEAANLYPVSDFPEIVRVPDKLDGQWYERVDLDIEMYEAVVETITRPTVSSVEVIGQIPTGQIFDVRPN